jgi:hypothetical protein
VKQIFYPGIFASFFCALGILISCQKQANTPNTQEKELHKLRFESASSGKMNEAFSLYDSTVIYDSASYVNQPKNRIYEWHVMPNNECSQIVGNASWPFVELMFHCPGTYEISANIYDTITHSLVARTEVAKIFVSDETLMPKQKITPGDTLIINPFIRLGYPYNDTSEFSFYLRLSISTSTVYNGNYSLEYHSSYGSNHWAFDFSDSINLSTYPFGSAPGAAQWTIEVSGLRFGIPTGLSFGWLGQTYQGSITLLPHCKYSLDWQNTGLVKFVQ